MMAGVCLFTACYGLTGMRARAGICRRAGDRHGRTPINEPANGARASGARLILVASPNERLRTATAQCEMTQRLVDIEKSRHSRPMAVGYHMHKFIPASETRWCSKSGRLEVVPHRVAHPAYPREPRA